MHEALQYLRGLRGLDVPLIAFIGHVCRTWYIDEGVVCAVMEILRETRMYRPVHSKPVGFDFLLRNTADRIGLVGLETDSLGSNGTGRDPVMLDGVAMVVVFPVEKSPDVDEFGHMIKNSNKERHDWSTSDPEMAPTIRAMGLPVLAVYRDGATKWVPPGGET